MTTREKTIIAATLISVLYGVYTFMGPSPSAEKRPRPTGMQLSELSGFVTGIANKLPKEKDLKTDNYLISRAAATWPQNPFLTLEAPIQAARETAPPLPEDVGISYTGYIQMGAIRLAIINGLEYEAGEALELPGFRLTTIYPNRVEILRVSDGAPIVIPLEEIESQPENPITERVGHGDEKAF
jgi:hypothetical protein